MLFLAIFIFVFSVFCQELTLHEQAEQWSHATISRSSLPDAQFILNLLFWSYQRSASTLCAQQAFLASQQLTAQAIYSITSRRLNPAREQIYHVNDHDLHHAHEKFMHHFQEHHRIGDRYSTCIELLFKKDYVAEYIGNALQELRQQARTVIAQALYQQVHEIDDHLNALKGTVKDSYQLFEKMQSTRKMGASLFNYVWNFLPALMVKSFVHADQQLTDVNHQLWDALLKSEAFGNFRWRIIEEKRAEFYATYYNAVYRSMQSAAMPQEAFLNLFESSQVLPSSLPSVCMV